MEGEKWYECKGCINKWDSTFHYCETCLPAVKERHTPGHKFASYTVREIKHEDDKHVHVQCLECSKSTLNPSLGSCSEK